MAEGRDCDETRQHSDHRPDEILDEPDGTGACRQVYDSKRSDRDKANDGNRQDTAVLDLLTQFFQAGSKDLPEHVPSNPGTDKIGNDRTRNYTHQSVGKSEPGT